MYTLVVGCDDIKTSLTPQDQEDNANTNTEVMIQYVCRRPLVSHMISNMLWEDIHNMPSTV